MMSSYAPCACGRMIYDIPLTGYSEPDGKGGTWHAVVPGGKCLDCGEPLLWLHIPAPNALKWDFSAYQAAIDKSQKA